MKLDAPQTILAATGKRLAEFAALQNIALAPLADSVGIRVDDLGRSGLRISLAAFMRLLHLLETVSGDDCIGLRYALFYQQGDSGAFGFALLNAPSLREALRVYHSYQRIVADHGFFGLEEEHGVVAIRWRYARLVDFPQQYSDFHAALMVKMLRAFLGPCWNPSAVALLREAPRSAALHQAHFGPGVRFGASGMNEVRFPASALGAGSADGDPRLFEMMEMLCRQEVEKIDRSKDLRLIVSEHILSLLPSGRAGLAKVAAAMGVGERSLQRRLSGHGTSFERLLEETRRDLSDRLLATAAPLSEISYLCGYSNSSAYSRAARGWYGMAPQEMRRQLTAGRP